MSNSIKVTMFPMSKDINQESGIKRVCEAYEKYGPEFGIEYIDRNRDDYDLIAIHAGMNSDSKYKGERVVAHLHGLYFTNDYPASGWEWKANQSVILSIRMAKEITVPSKWVAETIQRDVRVNPHVIPHGIDWKDFEPGENYGYVLFNKNRDKDVCDTTPLGVLAQSFEDISFVSTFRPRNHDGSNMRVIGLVSHDEMKEILRHASVYLSTTKETFGIGILEALASGVPVLGYAYGGNLDIVQHGVNGYLAEPGNYEDLKEGLNYCLKYRDVLSKNALVTVRKWDWRTSVEKLAQVYRKAIEPEEASVSVIIPSYNYADKVGRAIESALAQTYQPKEIIVVDDGSDDNGATREVVESYRNKDKRVMYIWQENRGVAEARNTGIYASTSKYVSCLDADDAIKPNFLEVCVKELEKDNTLGIAYTKILAIYKDGREIITEWPGDFNYERQLERRNQIPTCCVFRREMFERLGGYRQRYAPKGAGAEDAEFWLRAGAYGWNAKKVSDEGLFVYSLGTGRVSGNKDYKEIDWTAWHPWTKDHKHPFPSVATPKFYSHPVRQYDQPVVSVIIPVGKGHEKELYNALDSLEAQTFRTWEAIVVWDNAKDGLEEAQKTIMSRIERAYPYARYFSTGDQAKGAGYARNLGVSKARASLILFLDADDWFYPEAIAKMLTKYNETLSIVYSDYVGKTYINQKAVKNDKYRDRVLYYDPQTEEAVIYYKSHDYSCEKAIAQPNKDLYIWCLISSLVPKKWHDDIGGFDESMESFEDWDYWIRMAKAGKCFSRIDEPLVVYRFYTGNRRESGLSIAKKLINYLLDKYKGVSDMPCTGCRGKSTYSNVSSTQGTVVSYSQPNTKNSGVTMNDEDFVLVRYNSLNRGQHKVIGQASGRVIDYGYRSGGEIFYVHKADVASRPGMFTIVDSKNIVSDTASAVAKLEEESDVKTNVLPPPVDISQEKNDQADVNEYDLESIPGITSTIVSYLNSLGVYTLEDLDKMSEGDLRAIKGIGRTKAKAIKEYVSERLKQL